MKNPIYLALLATALIHTSCQDEILNKIPKDKFTDALVWSDPKLIDSYLLSQYFYTPVMIQDATTVFTSWNAPAGAMNRDPSSGNANYAWKNSVQIYGAVQTLGISDETKIVWAGSTDFNPFKLNGISSNGGMSEYWENAYYTVRNLNEFIAKVQDSPVSTEFKQLRVAEARFLRAYIYFSMVKRYGGVPLLTTVPQLNSTNEILYPKRSSEKEIYDFVISETQAIAEPLAAGTEYGRANKWSDLALLSRAALYAGSTAQFGEVQLGGLLGIPKEQAANYYKIAYDAANAIIQSGKYSLYNGDADKIQNFKNVFLKKRNCEAIMAKQFDSAGFADGGLNTWSWDELQAPEPTVWGHSGMNGPYLELVEEFEHIDGTSGKLDRTAVQQGLWTVQELWKDKDPRFFASIWTNETPWPNADGGHLGKNIIDFHKGLIKPDGTILKRLGQSFKELNSVGAQSVGTTQWGNITTGFGVMKYLDPTCDNMKWLAESRTDYLIFRYGEVLLNFAEAANELGKSNEALYAVNQIRTRAGIAPLSSIDREKIHHERKVELVFENHRYWDLRRWREAESKLSRSFSGLQYILDYTTKKYKIIITEAIDGTTTPPVFPRQNYYFPITKGRIGANSNLIENPGY